MVFDSTGAPIICEFGANRISKIDPATIEIKEWTLPNAGSRPRRIAITIGDIVWYAEYSRGFLGRLHTKTGTVSEWPLPGGPTSQPYGITAIHNVAWYSGVGGTSEHDGSLRSEDGESPDVGHPRRRRGRPQ